MNNVVVNEQQLAHAFFNSRQQQQERDIERIGISLAGDDA
jgi:hypothetical protein